MNCTLLSALPHSLSDVECALPKPHSDYVRGILQGHGRPAVDVWRSVELALGRGAAELFELCRSHGVRVVRAAGRTELTAAAASSDLLIILAHWKGPDVACVPRDLLASPSVLRDAVRECARRRILSAADIPADWESMVETVARQTLADALNAAIDRWPTWFSFEELSGEDDGADVLAISGAFARNHARSTIDSIFGEKSLLPGARLELADGLWRPTDIAACFPEGWEGMCDFVCCTSEYLAEETKCRRSTATFRADSRLLYPAVIIPALGEIIRCLHAQPPSDTRSVASIYMEIAYACDAKFGGN